MRRQRRISEFGEAEFLGASFHDAPQSARQRLAAWPFEAVGASVLLPGVQLPLNLLGGPAGAGTALGLNDFLQCPELRGLFRAG